MSSPRRLRCVVDHGLAYEAILCLALLTGEIPIDRYEWGVEIRRLWTVVPESSKRSFTALRPGAYHIWVALLGLVRGADEPRDVQALTRLSGQWTRSTSSWRLSASTRPR